MFLASAILIAATIAANPTPLAGTSPLTLEGDIPMQMVAGIDTYLNRALEDSVSKRAYRWHRDFSSHESYTKAVETNRQHLAAIIGATDSRSPANLETFGTLKSATVGGNPNLSIHAVRWNVFRNVYGEGLMLEPVHNLRAQIVLIPDCDIAP
ncbi:MAG: hypothetical protein IT366_09100, partial [Candidatus Hydrogenedentes bacterium]|nr:hypothetical protein [Candidatus Hydrogenedentota bacterium]